MCSNCRGGQVGGSRGEAPPLRILTPPNTPPSNHYLPHSTIFEFDSPIWKILAPLPQKFWLPYLKNFGFCKKGPTPLVQFWWLPPQDFRVRLPYLKNFDSPTWKIMHFELHSDSPSSILVTPPLKNSELDSPTWKNLTPLLEKFCILSRTQTPLVQFWGLPLSGFQSWTPLPENFWLP